MCVWCQVTAERPRTPERLLSAVYMTFIACVFFIYSLYHSCTRIQPVLPKKRHDTDICGIEAGRRRCADITHSVCCCGIRRCNAVALALCCASCFLCSLGDACCSVCRKNIQCGPRTVCRRPSAVIFGLFVRIFVREAIAAAGPLLVIYFEEELTSRIDTSLDKSVVVVLAIVGASLAAYLVGALIGVWIEASLNCCCTASCCGRSSSSDDDDVDQRNHEKAEPAKEEIRLMVGSDD